MKVSAKRHKWAILVLLACSAALLSTPARAAGAVSIIAPHVAHYLLSLNRSRGSSIVKAVEGHLEIHVAASCDGWTVQQYVGFNLLAEDDVSLEHLARLNAFEAADGSELLFTSQTWEDRALVDELRGVARRRHDATIVVRYSAPVRDPQTLPRGTLFPTAHIAALITQARRGGRQMRTVVFDGSTEDNPFEVAAIIGDERRGLPAAGAAAEALAEHSRWPIRLAYFRPGAVRPMAEFEMSVELFENGVAGHMVFDYGDFAMDVQLDSLTLHPTPSCEG